MVCINCILKIIIHPSSFFNGSHFENRQKRVKNGGLTEISKIVKKEEC